MTTRACFPGSFQPLTVAHLAVADAAFEQLGVAGVDLLLSESALGKEGLRISALERAQAISAATATRPWLAAHVRTERLLVDLAAGYRWLVVGADKWQQLIDPSWYGGITERDAVLRRLPGVAVVAREGSALPRTDELAAFAHRLEVIVVDVDPRFATVSSTAVRAGRTEWHAR